MGGWGGWGIGVPAMALGAALTARTLNVKLHVLQTRSSPLDPPVLLSLCGSSHKRPVQLDSPRTNAHLEANQTNWSCSHVQMTMLLMLLMSRSFFDQMTIVLAADDHEYDSVVRLWPCCKVTFETLPVALSARACRFLLLHFGNVCHAKSTSF